MILEAVRHSLKLTSGRELAFYTFPTGEDAASDNDGSNTTAKNQKHPVLFFHGFPGSGIEGGLCAADVVERGGELYSFDRPGFGYTDPLSPEQQQLPEDERMDLVIQDVWELVQHLQWTEFSVIGVSGGGPYVLALLASYLQQVLAVSNNNDDKKSQQQPPAKLVAVADVCGAHFPAGIEGTLPNNQRMFSLASKGSSSWSVVLLKASLAVIRLVTKLKPTFLLKGLNDPLLPAADRETFAQEEYANIMMQDVQHALRQGVGGPALDACILFRSSFAFEKILHDFYINNDDNNNQTAYLFPRVALFHGDMDVNVPPSHADYVFEKIFHSKVALHKYPDMGHLSLAVRKAPDIVKFVVPQQDETK